MSYEDEPTACLQQHNHSELYVGLWWGLSGSIISLCIVNFHAYWSYPFEKLASFVCSAGVFFSCKSSWQLEQVVATLLYCHAETVVH